MGSALASSRFILEPAAFGSLGHGGSFCFSQRLPLPKPCHTNLIQTQQNGHNSTNGTSSGVSDGSKGTTHLPLWGKVKRHSLGMSSLCPLLRKRLLEAPLWRRIKRSDDGLGAPLGEQAVCWNPCSVHRSPLPEISGTTEPGKQRHQQIPGGCPRTGWFGRAAAGEEHLDTKHKEENCPKQKRAQVGLSRGIPSTGVAPRHPAEGLLSA